MIDAVVFDLDGVLIQSEEVWDEVREEYVRERGGRYDAEIQRAMMGMSSPSGRATCTSTPASRTTPEEINAEVVRRMLAAYRDAPAAHPRRGRRRAAARRAVPARARVVVEPRADRHGARASPGSRRCFAATVSSEEVAHGKPAPDVYLEAARRLGVAPDRCTAVEDSHGGIRSAKSRRHARHRDPEPELSARRRGARARGRRPSRRYEELTPERVEGA